MKLCLFGGEKLSFYINTVCFDITDSTNKRARCYAQEGSPIFPTLFLANGQSEGRGRMGRSFYSPKDEGLYMTLLSEVPSSNSHFTSLTALSAVALYDALFETFEIKADIKWVNDLYFKGKKIAGILAESFEANGKQLVALGMGINLSTSSFPEELSGKAGAIDTARSFSDEERKALAITVCEKLLTSLASPDLTPYMQKYRNASCVIGKNIIFSEKGVSKKAKAVDITPLGALEVVCEDGSKLSLISGEISLVTLGDKK